MSPQASAPNIHRLIDIVVEEVSLVDRAANQRRFLIVKRSLPMSSTQETNDQANVNEHAVDDQGNPDSSPGDAPTQTGVIDAAVEALERLTDVVEELRDSSSPTLESRLQEVTAELRAIAQTLLEVSGNTTEPESEVTPDGSKPDALAAVLGSVRTALEQIRTTVSEWKAKAQAPGASAAAVHPKAKEDAAKGEEAAARAQKDLLDAVTQLTESVKAQNQRLIQLEKRFGLPNGSSTPERSQKKAEEEVGWPMDLNRPFNRDNVDASVSFHDLT